MWILVDETGGNLLVPFFPDVAYEFKSFYYKIWRDKAKTTKRA